jgi:hypothetical protein
MGVHEAPPSRTFPCRTDRTMRRKEEVARDWSIVVCVLRVRVSIAAHHCPSRAETPMPPTPVANASYDSFVRNQITFSIGDHVLVKVGLFSRHFSEFDSDLDWCRTGRRRTTLTLWARSRRYSLTTKGLHT